MGTERQGEAVKNKACNREQESEIEKFGVETQGRWMRYREK